LRNKIEQLYITAEDEIGELGNSIGETVARLNFRCVWFCCKLRIHKNFRKSQANKKV